MGGILPSQTYFGINAKTQDLEVLRQKLKLKHFAVKKLFSEKYPHADSFFKERGLDPGKIREHSAKLLGAGAVAGTLLLANPGIKSLPTPTEIIDVASDLPLSKDGSSEKEHILVRALGSVLPSKVRPLVRNEEKLLEQVFENILGVRARATLEGEHLNTTFGFIGAEQHLRRFPGDNLAAHGEGKVLKEGMAPGLGAWDYFANSPSELTPELVEKEKWYAVVQTLYLPDWSTRQPYLKNWYRFRKVLIVNTDNGKAVVASIADSGPAAWTGKHYGGSPEVMDHLGGPRYKKGPVIVFFVDDPENKVPLGPIDYNNNTQIAGF